MGKFKDSFVSIATLSCSRAVAFMLATTMAIPSAFAGDLSNVNVASISKGDTAPVAPDVATICKSMTDANSGEFAKNGGFMMVKDECVGRPIRQQAADGCQVDRGPEIMALSGDARQKRIDEICGSSATLKGDAGKYCAIRNVTAGGQAQQYCDAYNSANRAQDGLTAMLAIDGGAAALCWTEYAYLKGISSTGTPETMDNQAKGTGPCSYASIGAGLAEIVNIVLANTGSNNHATGEYSIDSSNNPQKKDDKTGVNITKILDIVMSSGLSLAVIRNGLCQQTRGANKGNFGTSEAQKGALSVLGPDGAKKFCGFLNNKLALNETKRGQAEKDVTKADSDLRTARDEQTNAETSAEEALQQLVKGDPCSGAATNYSDAKDNVNTVEKNGVTGSVSGFGNIVAAARLPAGPKVCTKQDYDAYEKALAEAKRKVKVAKSALAATDATAATAKKLHDAELAAQTTNSAEAASQQMRLEQARTNLQPRIDVTKSSAQMLSVLAAIRGVSLVAASSTKGKAKDILQSMFTSSGPTAAALGAGGFSGGNTGIYVNGGSSTFTPALQSGGTSSAITAGSPESFLLPKGSPLASKAEQIASSMPASKAQEAAAGGAAGVGGLISGMAEGMGGRGIAADIHAVTASAFANMPKDDGAGYSGGGGAKMASKGGDSGGGLDLKGLFGAGGEKEEHAAAGADLAYRAPAADDIWHSQNPKGNNLFQIVSDRYDTAQRKQDLNP